MIAQTLVLVAAIATGVVLIRGWNAVRRTTLTTARSWAFIACGGWIAAAVFQFVAPRSAGVNQLWYMAAVLTLCPWIAVLGGRRPTVRVWNWFVVVPLLAVLLWPVALCWMPRGPERLTLETPHLIGFGLVLVMGTGNYLGTKFGATAVGVAVAELMLVTSIRAVDPTGRTGDMLRAAAGALVFACVLRATAVRPSTVDSKWDALWEDFRNAFGIVWANRIAERVNAQAAKESWRVRLQPRGFVSVEAGQPADCNADAERIDHAMRWLLRRFVDEEWIDARVGNGPNT